MENVTPRFSLSKKELLKSLRDAILIGGLGILLAVFKIVPTGDFGAYQAIVVELSVFGTAIVNRWLNILRV